MAETDTPDFRLLFESVPGLYLVLRPDALLSIIAVSAAYLQATKTKREEILGRGLFEVFPDNPDDPHATGVSNLATSLQSVIRNRIPHTMAIQKYDIRRPAEEGGGFEERWWSPVNSPVFNESGTLVYIIYRVEDVTEFVRLKQAGAEQQKLYAQEVQESQRKLQSANEERLSSIISLAVEAIISINEEQNIILYNEGAEKIFGWSQNEALGKPRELLLPRSLHFIHRSYVKEFGESTQKARRMGDQRPNVLGLRKNGEEFPAEASISKLQLGGQKIFSVVLRDMTEQKRKEREQLLLAEAGAVLASSLDQEKILLEIAGLAVRFLADCCVVELLNDDNQIHMLKVVHADPKMAETVRILESSPPDRNRPHLTSSTLEAKKPILLSEISIEYIKSIAQSEEHLKALLALAPVSQMGLPLISRGRLLGVLLLLSSNSRRRYTPEDLKLGEELAFRAALAMDNARLYQEARRAISAREQILGIVAHDLRNPLNSIHMITALLLRRLTDEKSQRQVKVLEQSIKQANRLVQDLLDVTSIEEGKLALHKTYVPPSEILAEASQTVALEAAEAELHLEVSTENSATLYVDRGRLLQVFSNLVGNALKFTPSGGKILLKATEQESGICFCVQDTGPGIPQENLPHLFERFWQAKEGDRRGAGLGLSIAKGIVEAHKGHIWVESTPGQGSHFYFIIPFAQEHS